MYVPYTGLRATCCENHLKWFGKIYRMELYFPIRSSPHTAKHNQHSEKLFKCCHKLNGIPFPQTSHLKQNAFVQLVRAFSKQGL